MRWLGSGFLLGVIMCARVASAQDEAEARALFDQAEQAYAEERWQTAAELYARSHAVASAMAPPLATRGLLKFNEGRALEHLPGRERDALEAYRASVRETPADSTDPNVQSSRAEALRRIEELETRVGGSISPIGPAIAGVGGGIALIGLGVGIGALVMHGDLTSQCVDMICPESLAGQASTIEALAITSDVLLPIGAAAFALGLVLTFTITESSSGASVTTACGPTGCELSLGWRM